LSTVMRADNIYVMESGRILETGTHAELLAKGAASARIHAVQFADKTQLPGTASTTESVQV